MLCPNCNAEVREGAAFCGSCGATIEAAAGATEPMSPPPAAPAPSAGPSPEEIEYQRQMAEYERQKAAYDQAQLAATQAAYQQPEFGAQYAQPAEPPKRRKTGCVIAIVGGLVLLLLACSAVGYFGYRAYKKAADAAIIAPEPEETGDQGDESTGGSALDSYPTAEEAVRAHLSGAGIGDWISQLADEGDGWATYWAGPPNSEFVDEMYVEQNADGSWSVIEVYSIGDAGFGEGGPADEAMVAVWDYLAAVYEDRGMDAQSYTVDPFRSDSASAQESAGGLDYYDVYGYTEEADGTFWVQTTQSWYGEEQGWEYWVVPTEAGYYIADVRPL